MVHPDRRGAGHGLSGILGATGAERCGTGHGEAIYDATNQHNARGDRQVCTEVADGDRFPSDEGAEQNAKKQCAVVSSERRTALVGKVVCKPGLLGREEQLRHSRTYPEGRLDKHACVESEPQQ